jgi:hypothetical protein
MKESSSISESYDGDGEQETVSGSKPSKQKFPTIASAPLRGRHKESCVVQ